MISVEEALGRLREGNRRFVTGEGTLDRRIGEARRGELVEGQNPFAVILGCSDSRVPVEIVFDQGLGDVFVIRVAGNVVAPSLVASVEFAAGLLGTRLVVVLGHTGCGAVGATLDALTEPGKMPPGHLPSIVERVRPAVEGLLATDLRDDREALARQAVRANVRVSADHLRHGSEVLERLILEEGLKVVGAEYDLATGVVEFFEGVG